MVDCEEYISKPKEAGTGIFYQCVNIDLITEVDRQINLHNNFSDKM
jgi:hypothetical protein